MKPNNPHIPCFTESDKTGFCPLMGNTGIVFHNEPKDGLRIDYGVYCIFEDNGMNGAHNHPVLFNSFEQFLAYWQFEMKELEYILAKSIRPLPIGTQVEYNSSTGFWHCDNNHYCDHITILSSITETKESARERLLKDGWIKENE